MSNRVNSMADKLFKELNIKIKPVYSKQDLISARNFSAILKPTRNPIEIKQGNYVDINK